MKNALVLGGTGFVGRHVCEALQREGWLITVPTRRARNARAIQHLPRLTVLEADVHNAAALSALVAGHDVVINLVAILHGNAASFEHNHVRLPGLIAQACRAQGVRRLIHISALGAEPHAPSLYQRSKARGEAVLQAAAIAGDLDLTLIRPSVIFGAGDKFLNTFAALQSVLPFVPLAGAGTRFQPVWVGDVAQAVVHCASHAHTIGQTIDAVGPDVLSLADLVRLAGAASGHPRPVFGVPEFVGQLQAGAMALMPGEPLMSRDNLRSMRVDNVRTGSGPDLQTLGITPAGVQAIVPTYLRAPQGTA
jgi:NADH dehydrogenase